MRSSTIRSKRSNGISLLSLLVFLVLIAGAGLFIAKRTMFKLTGGDEDKLKAFLSKEFEKELFSDDERSVIEEAEGNYFLFKRGEYSGGFRFSGAGPSGNLEKLTTQGWTTVFDRVSGLNFSYVDIYGNNLELWEAEERPDLIAKIIVTISVHSQEEFIDHFSQSGIDLDGDPNNGMAKVKVIGFTVDLDR